MQWILWIALIAIAVIVYRVCRPLSFADDPVQARGRYVIYNRFTGYAAFNGRTFRTARAAQKLFERQNKKFGVLFPDMLEVRLVL